MSEIKIPSELQRVAYRLYPGSLPYRINLPASRGFGVSKVMETDNPATLVPGLYTHLQLQIAHPLNIPAKNYWYNVQAINGSGVASPEWLINNQYLHPDTIIASEMIENWYNHGLPNRSEEVCQGWYNRMKSQFGVTSPNQTRLYSDYWLFAVGGDMSASFISMDQATLLDGLSSKANARKMANDNVWGSTSSYFSGPVNYRNLLLSGYQSNHWRWREGIPVYNMIYDIEKNNLAFDEYRRMLKFAWTGMEGIQSRPIKNGLTNFKTRFPGGSIIRAAMQSLSPLTVMQNTFWHLLLADDIVYWNVSSIMSDNPHKFAIPEEGPSHNNGSYGNIRWQQDGGSIVQYNPSNPSHPNNIPTGNRFPYAPEHAETAAFSGAWLYSQISGVSDRVSYGLRYAPFRYRIGSGSWQSGYFDGNNPKNGSLGNARVSEHGTKNYGQDNVVRSFFANMKPVYMSGSGAAGGSRVFYIPKAPLNETITIEDYVNSTRTYTCVGPGTHVFYE